MSTMTKNELRNLYANQMHAGRIQKDSEIQDDNYLGQQPPISTLVRTMLEIIKIKKSHTMDEETRKQFPALAKEIIFLAEQTR